MFCMMMYMSILIILSKNPYFLMITLLIMTFGSIIMLSNLMMTQFYSMLILLVFVGGLLVMFLYMISLIPTEAMKFNLNLLLLGFPLIMISFKYFNSIQLIPSSLNINMMYSFVSIIFFFMLFLLWTLFSATFITNMKMGPLRMI